MDNNSDTLYSRLINWLLQESDPAASSPTGEQAQEPSSTGEPTAADLAMDQLDPLDFEELNIASFTTGEAAQNRTKTSSNSIPTGEDIEPGGETRPYNLGEMLTVQNRFEAILKRRLQVEIERHPPLFPWETEISDYESDVSDAVADRWVPSVRFWMPQLSRLALPVSMPENVLAKLLEACSEASYSRHQIGRKLVNAVENLFPDQFHLLNNLAGMVLVSTGPARGELEQLKSLPYEEATAEQKMTLALLAAKEIISTLKVEISPNHTPVERQWDTEAGVVTVTADYQLQDGVPRLRVTSCLPRGGSLTLRTPQVSAKSERIYPGYLSVESFDLQPNQIYPLEIRFYDMEQPPLIFAICPTL